MQSGICRFLRFCLRPVLPGLLLAALAPVGPTIADQVTTDVPAVPWHGLAADTGEAAFPRYPAGLPGATEFEFLLRETGDRLPLRGLFFRTADGLRVGAQGSFDPHSGDLRAIFALQLDF